MAGKSVHNIAVTMSADMSTAIQKFEQAGRSIKKLEKIQSELAKDGKFNKSLDDEVMRLKKVRGELIKTKGATKSYFTEIKKGSFNTLSANQKLAQTSTALVQARMQLEFNTKSGRKNNTVVIERIRHLTQLEAKLKTVAMAERAAGNASSAAAEKIGKGQGKMQQAMGQASFAVEDFMVTIETMGFSGAMRAAGNNLSMMGHILGGKHGPLIGGIIGVSAVAIPMLIKSFDLLGEKAKEVNKELSELLVPLNRMQTSQNLQLDLKFSIEDIQEMEGASNLEKFLKASTRQSEQLDSELKELIQTEQEFTDIIQKRMQRPVMANLNLSAGGEADLKKALDKLREDIIDTPKLVKDHMEAARKEIDKVFDDERLLNVDKIAKEKLFSDFSATEMRIDKDHQAALVGLNLLEQQKDLMDEITTKGVDLATKRLSKEEEITNELAKQKEARAVEQAEQLKEQIKEGETLRKMGFDEGERAVQSVIDKVQKVMDQFDKATEHGGNRFSVPDRNDAVQQILDEEIAALKDQEPTVLSKGEALIDESVLEHTSGAMANMAAQIDKAAAQDDDDAKRRDLLTELQALNAAFQRNRQPAVIIGAGP
jgi:hypothetical protein